MTYKKSFDECEHDDWECWDEDDRGYCPDCGASCDWHYVKEVDDNYPDYIQEVEAPEPIEWYAPVEA